MTSEANDAVGTALEAWVHSLPDAEPGEDVGMLGDWAAITSMVRINSDGEPVVQYYLSMKGGTMLPHIVRGLFEQALIEVDIKTVDGE